MSIDEIFPNPTVKKVIFQIQFPNLFFIENKIGDFQMKIIDKFPKSDLIYRRQVVFIDKGSSTKFEKLPEEFEPDSKKIWQFKKDDKVLLNVLTDSLDISSSYHQTYNNPQSNDKFRDVIKFVLTNFFDVISISVINRVGLRYINECPVFEKSNDSFSKYYNSTFPINRFNLSDAKEMSFVTSVEKENHFLRYIESLQLKDEKCSLILDFDSFTNNVNLKQKQNSCLEIIEITDKLYGLISEEYKKTIKPPLREYMRGGHKDG